MEEVTPAYVTLAEGTIASDFVLKNLNKSLGEAQNEFKSAVKDVLNNYGGWKYTPLENIIAATRPALVKYHLTVSQFPVTDLERKTITLYTRVVHWDSGEWMQNALEVPGELALGRAGTPVFNQQTIGGSQTYAQKYAYKAIAGIPDAEEMIDSTDEKGDLPARTKAQGRQQTKVPQSQSEQIPQPTTQPSPQIPPAQPAVATDIRSKFFSKAKECGWGLADIKKFMVKAYSEASTAKLSEEQLNDALNVMAENKPEEVLEAA